MSVDAILDRLHLAKAPDILPKRHVPAVRVATARAAQTPVVESEHDVQPLDGNLFGVAQSQELADVRGGDAGHLVAAGAGWRLIGHLLFREPAQEPEEALRVFSTALTAVDTEKSQSQLVAWDGL